jgi:1-aminocyclopropane-1-carboxylate deaminase/D-cysteine desulfhydrase-like pyridoxal-dependent ACC family enzyme
MTSDAPGKTSMGGTEGSHAAGCGLSASSWKQWRCVRGLAYNLQSRRRRGCVEGGGEANPGESRGWDSTQDIQETCEQRKKRDIIVLTVSTTTTRGV